MKAAQTARLRACRGWLVAQQDIRATSVKANIHIGGRHAERIARHDTTIKVRVAGSSLQSVQQHSASRPKFAHKLGPPNFPVSAREQVILSSLIADADTAQPRVSPV